MALRVVRSDELAKLVLDQLALLNQLVRAVDIVDVPAARSRYNDVLHRSFHKERSALLASIAFSSAGLKSSADSQQIASTPYALATPAQLGL